MIDPSLVLGALAAEAVLGYPAPLHRYVPHPVTWIGHAIQGLDARWNIAGEPRREFLGVCCVVIVTGLAAAAGLALSFAGPVAVVLARIAGDLVVLAGLGGWRTMWRDARKHASPNAGWPEAAMAGALGIQLGGSVTYDGVPYARPAFGSGLRPNAAILRRGLRLYVVACGLMWGLLALGGFAWRQ